MALTLRELGIECLKQVDAGNGDKIVMVKNDVRFGGFNPIFSNFEDNNDVISSVIKTEKPSNYILLG